MKNYLLFGLGPRLNVVTRRPDSCSISCLNPIKWGQRYSSKDYAYGTKANDFLVSMYDMLPTGKTLCLEKGEGRNAVWLAEQGNEVTAVDASEIGLIKN